jgi:hypothetical protein
VELFSSSRNLSSVSAVTFISSYSKGKGQPMTYICWNRGEEEV